MRLYSLAFLTVFDAGPLDAVRIAAAAGYDQVGLRLLPASPIEPPYPLLTGALLLKEMLAALRDTGVSVGDVELVRLKPETDVSIFRQFLERAERLGARHAIVVGDDDVQARLTDNFGKFCALAALHGLTADLEFMPWTKVPNLALARQIVEAAGHDNGGVLIDALHFHRSGSSLDEVQAVQKSRMHLFQICDAPDSFDPAHAALIHTARAARMIPGEGGIDLWSLVRLIPQSTVISVEVPNQELSSVLSAEDRARRALHAAKSYFPDNSTQP